MANRVRNRAQHRMDRLKKYRAGRGDAPAPPPRARHHSDPSADSVPESLFGSGTSIDDLLEEAKIIHDGSRELGSILLDRTREWCSANGISPHPRVESAAKYMSGAAMVGYRSRPPGGKTRQQVSREALETILQTVGERDDHGIAEAIVQIQEAMKTYKS